MKTFCFACPKVCKSVPTLTNLSGSTTLKTWNYFLEFNYHMPTPPPVIIWFCALDYVSECLPVMSSVIAVNPVEMRVSLLPVKLLLPGHCDNMLLTHHGYCSLYARDGQNDYFLGISSFSSVHYHDSFVWFVCLIRSLSTAMATRLLPAVVLSLGTF